jgi:hypothetical protein
LERENVAVLRCDGFGSSAVGRLRISLTARERRLAEAGRRIVRFARERGRVGGRQAPDHPEFGLGVSTSTLMPRAAAISR